jgi:hypothetical protein
MIFRLRISVAEKCGFVGVSHDVRDSVVIAVDRYMFRQWIGGARCRHGQNKKKKAEPGALVHGNLELAGIVPPTGRGIFIRPVMRTKIMLHSFT